MDKNILRHINPFLYAQESPWKYRFVGFFGFLATVSASIGLVCFFSLNKWYWIVFGPMALVLFFNHGLRDVLRMFYHNFSKERHLKFVHDFWKNNKEPFVAIFLPWCGEDLAIYERTIAGASNLHYQNKNIYILDDKGDDRAKALADKYGLNYLSRPNKGEYRKSGNLQYGWDHSQGEDFAFVLDADFVPFQEALFYIMPYILSDPKIGILQTPQYFEQTVERHAQSPIEFGGGNIVEEFYKIDQTSRDTFAAAICVGTSAVYRRAAIEAAGGTPKVWGTEDVRTGLSITIGGFRVKYIPLIISIGTVPSTLQDYFRQHNRWCSGSILILYNYYWKAKLSLMGRIIYLANPLYYISEALVPLFVFHYVFLLAFQYDTLTIYYSLWFVPKIFFDLFFIPVVIRKHREKLGSKLAALNNIFTYFYTIFFDMFRKSRLLWHPAGVAIGGISREFRMAMRLGIILSSLYIVSLMAVIVWRAEYLLNIQAWMVLLWSLYVATRYMIYIHYATYFLKTHDAVFVHPTSSLRTRLRRAWAPIKHILVPSLFMALFLSMIISMYQLLIIKNYKITVGSAFEISKSE